MLHRTLLLIAVLHLSFTSLKAQVYSDLEAGKKRSGIKDSLKETEYPYLLPILGKKVTKAGFSLPYSAGIGVNYVWTRAEVVMNNLQIGFNGGPMSNVDEIVRFDNVTTTVSGVNIRPDFWLLPFLNVYGIFAQSQPSTDIHCGIFVPDGNGNYTRVVDINTNVSFPSTTAGFGLTPTVGVAGGFLAIDMNFTWTDTEALAEPTSAFVIGPRFGKTFKLKKPESNLALYAGFFRLKLSSTSTGSIDLSEIFDTSELQVKVDNGLAKVDAAQVSVDTWWNGLTPLEQKHPSNIAKHDVANRAISAAGNALGTLDMALNDDQHPSVQYSLDKKAKNMWNFIVGSQYTINKHWMVRAEYGFLGSRRQLITGLQFRFGL